MTKHICEDGKKHECSTRRAGSKNKVIQTPVPDAKEGLQPRINATDSTTGFTGRIATDQLKEDIVKTPLQPQDWN